MLIIPIGTSTSIRRPPQANYLLIAINVVVFLADSVLGGTPQHRNALGAFIDQGVLLGDGTRLYQFVTHQFMHGGLAHIGGNMLFLWVFGNAVNAKMGNLPYLLFYLSCGVFAAVGHAFLNPDFAGMIGASGAVAGVTTAYLALFPRSYITIFYWLWLMIGTFELPSMILIIAKMILWDNVIVRELVGGADASNVAFDAHLAGYAFGFFASAALLALRLLPRDQFDIVALWRRWFQRQTMKAAMSDPNTRARAELGRVARPVSMDSIAKEPASDPREEKITELRGRVNDALTRGDNEAAVEAYAALLEVDNRQVLSRNLQLTLANHLYTAGWLPQAAAAYEKYLATYPRSPDAAEVRLLLGIIYARDLQHYQAAEGYLRQSMEDITDDRRREQCRHWLDIVSRGLRGA